MRVGRSLLSLNLDVWQRLCRVAAACSQPAWACSKAKVMSQGHVLRVFMAANGKVGPCRAAGGC